jgi:hypothetical protein
MQLQVALEVNLDLVQATERGGSRKNPQKSLSISFKPNPSTKASRIRIEHTKNEQTLLE